MERYLLNDVLENIHSGGTPSTEIKEYWNGNIKWLSSGETGNDFIFDTINKITEEGVKNSSTKLAKKNDVVMACAGQGKTRDQTSFLLDDMYINQSVIALTANRKKLLPLYLYYNLKNRYDELRGGSDFSSTRGSITTLNLKSLPIMLPSLVRQEKVVNILSTYDELIENNNRQIEILEAEAEELYKEWFVRFRFPGHESTPFENGLPQGWKWGTIKDVGEFIRGKNITSEEMIEGNIPVISAGIEPSGHHNKANVFGVSATVSNSGANAGYLSLHYDDIWAADCSYVQSENIFYLYELLNSMKIILNNLQKGAAQPHVYAKDINKIKIKLPNTELIIEANNIFSKIHIKIKDLLKQNELLKQQRDLLLPRLMSGKLEVERTGKRIVGFKPKMSFIEFKNEFKSAARKGGDLTEKDLKELYKAYCDDGRN